MYQLPDGSWRAAVSIGGGKRRTARARTQAEAIRALARLRDGAGARGAREYIRDYLSRWLETSARASVRASSYETYERRVRLHIVPAIGHVRLADLTPAHVQAMLTGLDLAPVSVRGVHAVLHRALAQAVRWELVPRNVAAMVDLPRVEARDFRPLTVDEARRLIDHSSEFRPLYAVALSMGLRLGELLGLRWQDVDLERRELHVRNQLTERGLVPVKSHRSRRALRIPPTVATMLTPGTGYVFQRDGRPLGRVMVRHALHRDLAECGIERRRFHDLRHTCGTILAASGVPLSDIQRIMGHATITVTMRYVHALDDTQDRAARRMDETLF